MKTSGAKQQPGNTQAPLKEVERWLGISSDVPVTATALHRQHLTALESALAASDPTTPIEVLAERVFDSEPVLMKRLGVQRNIWLLYRLRRRLEAQSKQLLLPGFERLPTRIVIKNRRWTDLQDANLGQLRQYRSILVKRRDPRIKQLDALISLMRRHWRNGLQIKVSDVMQKEHARLEALTPKTIN